jgi:hypothetical protein
MSDLRTAAKQALEALEGGGDSWRRIGPAIDALKTALEQPQCKRHNSCERLPDGYCARCHLEMYP